LICWRKSLVLDLLFQLLLDHRGHAELAVSSGSIPFRRAIWLT
jgi:hypothetical protein